MNKKELVMEIAQGTRLSQKDVEKVLSCFCDTVSTALERGEKVQLVGFGSFDVRERKARIGRNPRTGENVNIAAVAVPVFNAGKALKERVNETANSPDR